jgi:hypothetical protein
MEIGILSSKDEIFPGGNGLDHNGTVIPSGTGEIVVNVGIRPFAGGKIKNFNFVENRLVVPTAISVQLILVDENGVSTSTWRGELESNVDFNLLPLFGFEVIGEDVIKTLSCVEMSTMATINVDLVFVEATSGICTWCRCSNSRFLVFFNGLVTFSAGPDVVLCVKEPCVIQANFRGVMTSKNEQFVILRRDSLGYMLATGGRDFITSRGLFFPDPLVTHHAEGVHLLVRLNGLSLLNSFDTTVHDVLLATDVVKGVTRTGGRLVACLLL